MQKLKTEMNRKEYVKIISFRPNTDVYLGYEYELQFGDARDWDNRKRNSVKPKIDIEGFNMNWESICYSRGQIGWEIRSLVAPLNFHKILWRKILQNNPMEQGDIENNGAGIHVHIENNERTRQNMHKVFEFLHKADFERLAKMSGRDKLALNAYVKQHYKEKPIPVTEIKRNGRNASYELYSHCGIINSESEKTYEVRLFSARPHLLVPALEACDSLTRLSEEVDKITFENWDTYTKRHLRYKEINELIRAAA